MFSCSNILISAVVSSFDSEDSSVSSKFVFNDDSGMDSLYCFAYFSNEPSCGNMASLPSSNLIENDFSFEASSSAWRSIPYPAMSKYPVEMSRSIAVGISEFRTLLMVIPPVLSMMSFLILSVI